MLFTLLEHPMRKMAKSETNFKKESFYESHVRAGFVKTIEVMDFHDILLFLQSEMKLTSLFLILRAQD